MKGGSKEEYPNAQQLAKYAVCLVKSQAEQHYDDVIMTMLASQITSLTVVYSIVYSDVNQRKLQSSASLAFVWEIHRRPVNFPHKWPVTRKMFPFDDVIMRSPLGPFTQQLRHFSPRQRNATRKPGFRPRWETWCRGVVPGDRAKQAVWEEHYERPQMNSSIATGTRTPRGQPYVPPSLYSPGPMFPGPIFPGTYVPPS